MDRKFVWCAMTKRDTGEPRVCEFWNDIQQHNFLQSALMAGILSSIACGVIGSYVVTRRITYIAGSIAHSVLAGLGAARYFQVVYQWEWFTPFYGALCAALVSAIIIGFVSIYAKEREDTVIGAVWAVGMAAGVLFIFKTPGYNEDIMSYLFGNILMVSTEDLLRITGLDLLLVILGIIFYKRFLAVCFDEEFARLRGIKTELYYIFFLCLTAITVVLLVTVVGIVMVIALLTIPVAVAGQFTSRLVTLMVFSVIFTMIFTSAGLVLSYGPDLPAGAVTILLAATVYLAVVILSRVFRSSR
ncbi:MAG: metal ABC transporter permease [Syntrophales bacterium]|nr:metal ABC transporter permease [Syntrophales bacterium]